MTSQNLCQSQIGEEKREKTGYGKRSDSLLFGNEVSGQYLFAPLGIDSQFKLALFGFG
jgi:hypothetical protein